MNDDEKWLAWNLYLTAENDGQIYRRFTSSICKNLAQKKVRGIYSADLAITAFELPIKEAIPKFNQHVSTPVKLNPATRRLAARYLRDASMELINEYANEMKALKKAGKPWTLRGT